ncbi:hypothetical protein A4H97_05765 [Niastella yeongjuensis]|uniref:DUF1800 domain-containing protein n=1 Tax=Niastella yeongjuensis TaxID=354355 RepID=A0A1V9ELU5_9BACT|nr:DUF1800 domain-containing protein [Niastella yeongjuensis]OQP47022.1 hypothetical protein A4H97_05765 [Niastella yeongjuensis]SEN65878.1 Protein of unknown function [Niastella yeongjuensis]
MIVTPQLKNQHLLWRAGFGPMAEEYQQLATATHKSYVNALFKASAKGPEMIDVADNALKGLVMGIKEVSNGQKREQDEAERRKRRQQSREDIKSLNVTWLNQMVNSEQQLREKMALFWHGHFASRNLNILYQQQLLDIIRQNALGNFGDLLREVSKSASMINFLNNNQNRKGHPNENFAREVMELFTMGRGNYTENDIKEAARAFTGWGATISGEFAFKKFQHDDGQKTVLGKTGNFTGDDVLNILLEHKQTATYITRKIYRYFVNDVPDETHVTWLADRFYSSSYDIKELMKDIFTSDWFYDAKNIGCRIKSPVELIVGIRRVLPMKLENEQVQLLLQRLLGQLLFYPPNVAGWPGGKNWIDSSSLMFRLRIPQLIYDNDEVALSPKDDDDQMMGMKDMVGKGKGMGKKGMKGGQFISAAVDWQTYLNKFEKVPREKLMSAISGILIQGVAPVDEKIVSKYIDSSSRESFIKSTTIQLMSTPEYQLC